MRRAPGPRLLAAATVGAALALAASASAGDPGAVVVSDQGGVIDGAFAPDTTELDVAGDPVTWTWDPKNGNGHNVRQDLKLFGSGDPVNTRAPFEIQPSAGSYHYYCEVHGSKTGGMDGQLEIKPIAEPGMQLDQLVVRWSTGSGDTGDQFDVRYKGPDTNGEFKTWLKDTSKTDAAFGKNDKPTHLKPNKVYRFQARSEKSAKPSKHSDWSPTLSVAVGS